MEMHAANPTRVNILGVPVDVVDLESAVEIVRGCLERCGRLRIVAINPEKAMAVRRGALDIGDLATAELLIPDGIGVVGAVRMLYGLGISRVTGVDLMHEICKLAATGGYSVYLLGATEEVNARAASNLERMYPELRIAGRHHGYFGHATDEIVNDINASGADILFVALGSPRQERWIFENSGRLGPRIIQGVGGTLDTIAGFVKRAPAFVQRIHLEWLYRLIRDPRRVRRQIVLPLFALNVVRERVQRAFANN